MKTIKTLAIILISFIGLFIVWLNLPNSVLYHKEIRLGNEFALNIIKYKEIHGELPKESNWELLSSLNPVKPYENFYPEYLIIDDDNFSLTFIRGFDPPYLQYNSRSKLWEMK